MKSTLNGDRIPICRVEDLEITLVSPDLPVRVRLPSRGDDLWRSLSEVRAAEIQCMQLALALLARHESEMYVTIEEDKDKDKEEGPNTRISQNYQSDYNDEQRAFRTQQSSDIVKKHMEDCEKVFGEKSDRRIRTSSSANADYSRGASFRSHMSITEERYPIRYSSQGSTNKSSKRTSSTGAESADDSYNRFQRTTIRQDPLITNTQSSKDKTNVNGKTN